MSSDEHTTKNKNVFASENAIKGLFITSIASISALVSFSYAVAAAKKSDSNVYENNAAQLHATGSQLAIRALKWGTIYAVTGCGLIIFGVWKLANVKDMAEFRQKVGSIFPPVPKNNPPQSRTDFRTVTEFLQYLDDEYSTNKQNDSDKSNSTNTSQVE